MSTANDMVSIIIPMYNVANTLDQCLSSIEVQTHTNLEIICVNDGSPDNSSAIAHAHAAADPRITVIDKPNEGYGASCNRGMALARGAWTAIIEPDDYLEPTMFQELLRKASELSQVPDVVKCAYWRVFDENGRSSRVVCPYKGRVKPKAQPFAVGDGIELLLHHPAIWAAIYRTDFLRARNITMVEVPGAGWADNPFMVQTLCATTAIAYVDLPLYNYREHDLNDAEHLAARSPLVPLTRWNEMMDAALELGVVDRRVLEALALRGVNYASITLGAAPADAQARELAARSMARLDASLVLENDSVSPNGRRLYTQLLGLPQPQINKAAWATHLAKEGFYRVRANGLGFAVDLAKRRLGR